MFGHDTNQDTNQSSTAPTVSTDATPTESPAAVTPSAPPVATGDGSDSSTDAPTTSTDQPTDTDLGSFLPSQQEPAETASSTDDLLDIKQQALQSLSPLVSHLDQTPEEKFRTTMMMIQASDDHSLIKVAYEAATGIADEKERAQALLDIVNEINYFTQQPQAGSAE